MSIIKIPNPQTKQWSQLNKGDLLGTLYATRNIDLDSPGILKLAQRTRTIGSTTSGYFNLAYAILLYQDDYWVVSNRLFKLPRDLSSFAGDALANTPAMNSEFITDGCVWNNSMYVSGGDTSGTPSYKVSKLNGTTWTKNWSSAAFTYTGTIYSHPIEPNVTNANLLVGDRNYLLKCDAAGTMTTALTLPAIYDINWIRRGRNVNYIGLKASPAGQGAVAIWDGLDTTIEANAIIPIGATTPMSGVVDESGVLHIIQSDGRLMRFNGSGFNYEAELPPYRDYLMRKDWGGTDSGQQRVINRGMALVRGRIHIAIDSSFSSANGYPSFPSGVWVYDEENKAFYQKYSPSYINTISDFGQMSTTSSISAICPVYEGSGSTGSFSPNYRDPAETVGGSLIFGARVAGPSGVNRNLVSATTGENRGQFTTSKIESQNILDGHVSLWCKFTGVKTATDKIILKYRTVYRDPINTVTSGVIWVSSTVFTTNDDVSLAVVGDEVTIRSRGGAGSTAHISAISYSAPTYTITLDEAIIGVSVNDFITVIIDNWTKLNTTISYLDTKGYKQVSLPIAPNSTWIQIRGELRGEGRVVGIEELQLVNTDQQKAI